MFESIAGSVAAGALAWALTYLVHSTVLLGLAWCVTRWSRLSDGRLRAGAWQAALVGGLLTASIQLGAGLEPVGGRFVLPDLSGALSAAVAPPAADVEYLEISALDAASLAAPQAIPIEPSFEHPAAPESPADRWRPAIAMAWLSGALFGLLRFLTRTGRFRSRIADRLPVWDESALTSLEDLRLRAGVRRRVRLSRSRTIRVPLTWGVLRPEICVPDRALTDLTPAEFEAVLAHELGHVARGDAFWLGLGAWLGAVMFFQPLNRVGRRSLAREAEHLADAFAVQLTRRPMTLARCLAKVAGWIERASVDVTGTATAGVAAASMASSRGVLLERVERLLERRPAPRPRRMAALMIAATPLALLPVAPAIAADAPADAEFDVVEVDEDRLRAGAGSLELTAALDSLEPAEQMLFAMLEQLPVLRSEIDELRRMPQAANHSSELDALDRRLATLESLGSRAYGLIGATGAEPESTSPRNASRDVVPSSDVPDQR
ncbi:M56 family metallopeptidase [Engelhardtia mirabilis]|uniref:Heat shock protein HtpX n=1 Tax=Engelhardtia mirabilis TaxID=2528011 RepID=A0A518BN79_9BACT|nr:heat shock protein HtpX [Planctomycetes bacterium Pla133]QDV02764.1 heat shock protein HtpX [Planctomycetes bacterium Pla86]